MVVVIDCQWQCFVLNVAQKRKFPKFVVKEMESMFVEELKSQINLLMANLESLPVTKGAESKYSLQKLKRYKLVSALFIVVSPI